MEVEGTEAYKLRFKGNTEKQVTKAMNSPYGVILPEQSVNENILIKQLSKMINEPESSINNTRNPKKIIWP